MRRASYEACELKHEAPEKFSTAGRRASYEACELKPHK